MQAVMMKEDELIKSASEVFDIEANSILKLKERLNLEFVKAIDILYSSKGKVVVTGMGKSGLIGRKIASTLCSTGTPAVFLHLLNLPMVILELLQDKMLLLVFQTVVRLLNY